MKIRWNILAALMALVATGSAWASNPGELTVRDNGKFFTSEGIKAAKDAFAKQSYDSPTRILVVTVEGLPERLKADFAKLKEKSEKDHFVTNWARDEAKAEGAKGIFLLISSNPRAVRVLSSEQMRANREFGESKDARMQELLVEAFKASNDLKGENVNQGHDVGLLKAVEYAREQLKGTSAVTPTVNHNTPVSKVRTERGGSGMGVLGWVCLIGVVLLGVWLVVGLIRAVTGIGGGGGGYGPGYGGGYGGGGGGFMSSLLGGMFGSMAGMWMYNSFFGGGMSNMSAGDYGGSGAGYDNGDTGGGNVAGDDGNFDNGADGGGGGDWGGGGGDAGGGDFGGGDFGGGDFGGGGGDFGGGGGDW